MLNSGSEARYRQAEFVEFADQLSPAIENREDLVCRGGVQADRDARDPEIAVTRQPIRIFRDTREEHGRTEIHALPSSRMRAAGPPEPDLSEADPDGFGAFAALGDVDQHSLTFIEGGDPGSLEHRGVDESILAAIVANDEAEPLLGIEPLHRAGFLDGRFGREWCPASRRRIGRPPRRGSRRRAAVDTDNLGDLRSLLSRRHADFERFSRLHRGDAVAFEHAGMEEGVPRAVRQLDKPEASLGFEPFDDGAHRRAGWWCIETRLRETRGAAKFPKMRVIPVVVKIAAPGLTKIPVSDQVSFLSSRFTASSDRRERLFQKIDAGASGLIVTITTDEKTGLGLPVLRPQPQPVTLAACYPGLGFAAGTPDFTEVQFVAGSSGATKRKVDDREVGETAGKLTIASAGGPTLYDPPFLASPADLEAGG